jgi:phosphoenolpyruvate carboxykinase (ATP)
VQVPTNCTGVPDEILNPSTQWANKEEFNKTLAHLGELYTNNFKKYGDGAGFVTADVASKILAAGPKQAAPVS